MQSRGLFGKKLLHLEERSRALESPQEDEVLVKRLRLRRLWNGRQFRA